MKRFVAVIIAVFLLQACQDQEAQQATEQTRPMTGKTHGPGMSAEEYAGMNPVAGEWTLVAIDEQALTSGGTPTLVFENDGSCWGSTGVNKYRSSANFKKLANGLLELGPAAVTRMAGPPEAMALERMFLDRLGAVSSFRIEGDTLHLYAGEHGAVTFERVYR